MDFRENSDEMFSRDLPVQNQTIDPTYITRRIFPFGVSQHQSIDLHGATQTQPFRG
jgi:hypothetical protein